MRNASRRTRASSCCRKSVGRKSAGSGSRSPRMLSMFLCTYQRGSASRSSAAGPIGDPSSTSRSSRRRRLLASSSSESALSIGPAAAAPTWGSRASSNTASIGSLATTCARFSGVAISRQISEVAREGCAAVNVSDHPAELAAANQLVRSAHERLSGNVQLQRHRDDAARRSAWLPQTPRLDRSSRGPRGPCRMHPGSGPPATSRAGACPPGRAPTPPP